MRKFIRQIFSCRECNRRVRTEENIIKIGEILRDLNESERKLKTMLDDAQAEELEKYIAALESFYVEFYDGVLASRSSRMSEIMRLSIKSYVVNKVFTREFF